MNVNGMLKIDNTNRSFCVAPFFRVTMRTMGALIPCCNFPSWDTPSTIKQTTIEEYFNGSFMTNVKEKMLAGQIVTHCSTCYKSESLWNHSMRLDFNEKYKHQIDSLVNDNVLREIELHLGNYCNLKCLMCVSQDSSSMLIENLELKLDDSTQETFTLQEKSFDSLNTSIQNLLPQLNVLDLRGGETMLIPQVKQWLLSIDEAYHNKLTIRIQTNGTVFNDSWRQIFDRFSKIEIALSMDAYGDLNNYIRFPSRWLQIVENFKQFRSFNKVTLSINCTVSNLNWLRLHELLDFFIETNEVFTIPALHYPNYHVFTNLPKKLLVQYLPTLKRYRGVFSRASPNEQINDLINTMENYINNVPENPLLWQEFCKVISMRDQHRGNSIFDYYPELKDFWVE